MGALLGQTQQAANPYDAEADAALADWDKTGEWDRRGSTEGLEVGYINNSEQGADGNALNLKAWLKYQGIAQHKPGGPYGLLSDASESESMVAGGDALYAFGRGVGTWVKTRAVDWWNNPGKNAKEVIAGLGGAGDAELLSHGAYGMDAADLDATFKNFADQGKAINQGLKTYREEFFEAFTTGNTERLGEMAAPGLLGVTTAVVFKKTNGFGAGRFFESIETPPVASSVTSENRGVRYVLENASMSPSAQAYEDAIPGTTYDIPTRKKLTPALRFDNPNAKGRSEVRFDGVDPDDPMILIDRKLNATTRPKQVSSMLRWAEALKQNPGYSIRVEVPSQTAYRNMIRLINKAGVENAPIYVRVTP